MTLFGDSEGSCAVNLSLRNRAVERAHYLAKYDPRAVKKGKKSPVDVSVQYGGDELDDDEIEDVENYLSNMFTDEIGIQYLRD
jgi:hypothetical protein